MMNNREGDPLLLTGNGTLVRVKSKFADRFAERNEVAAGRMEREPRTS